MTTTTTTSSVRYTKADKFAALADYMDSMDAETEVFGIPASVLAEAMHHEVELLSRKNTGTRKPTAKQVENASVKEDILACMESGVRYTVSDLLKLVPTLADASNQKATALMRQLVLDSRVTKIEDKRKSYFALSE